MKGTRDPTQRAVTMTQELDIEPPARRRTRRTAPGQPNQPGKPERPDARGKRVEALLDELTSQTPAEAIRFMRRWHAGPLSLIHLHVMTLLQADGSIPMRSLAESLGVSQASVTGIVDRMEQRGLVERRREDDDRRVIRVQLAADGRELLVKVTADRRRKLGYLLSELTDDELDGFLRGARALRRARDRYLDRVAAGEVPSPDTDEATR